MISFLRTRGAYGLPDFVSIAEPEQDYEKAIEKFNALEKAESALPLRSEGHSLVV